MENEMVQQVVYSDPNIWIDLHNEKKRMDGRIQKNVGWLGDRSKTYQWMDGDLRPKEFAEARLLLQSIVFSQCSS